MFLACREGERVLSDAIGRRNIRIDSDGRGDGCVSRV